MDQGTGRKGMPEVGPSELGHRAWAQSLGTARLQPLQGAAGIYRGKAANDRGFLAGLGTEMT